MVYVEYKKFGEEQIAYCPVACDRGSGILIPELVATYNFWEIILVALTAMGLNFDE
jgi:hypothetical protein